MIHLLAKSAEVRGEEEVGVDARKFAQRAAAKKARDPPHAREISAVLHDGVNPAGFSRARDKIARIVHRLGHRLFAEDMASRVEGRGDDVMPRAGDDDVEQQFGLRLGEKFVDIAGDNGRFEMEFVRASLRAARVEIGEADDLDFVDLRGRLQPGAAHIAAANQTRPQAHPPLPPKSFSPHTG